MKHIKSIYRETGSYWIREDSKGFSKKFNVKRQQGLE
jgi:hypothetical protein